MVKTGKPRGTLRQKLGHAAIMAFFGAMWLATGCAIAGLAPVSAVYWAACLGIASGLWTIWT